MRQTRDLRCLKRVELIRYPFAADMCEQGYGIHPSEKSAKSDY